MMTSPINPSKRQQEIKRITRSIKSVPRQSFLREARREIEQLEGLRRRRYAGQIMRNLRIFGGFSARAVGEKIGKNYQDIYYVEEGKSMMIPESIFRTYAQVSGFNADQVMALGDVIAQDVREIILKRADVMSELIRRVQNFSDDSLNQLVVGAPPPKKKWWRWDWKY
jgi:hypothetical protein